MKNSYLGIEAVNNGSDYKYADKYTTRDFSIICDPMSGVYEMNIFNESLRHKIKAFSKGVPDAITIIDLSSITIAFIKESVMTVKLDSPEMLLSETLLEYETSDRPMVKITAESPDLFSSLEEWHFSYPKVVYGNDAPGQPYEHLRDDEFIVPAEMIRLEFNFVLVPYKMIANNW